MGPRVRGVPHAADARHGHFDLLAKRAFPLAPEGTTAGSNPDDENGFPKMFPSDIPLVPEHAAAPFCVCCPYFSWRH